jgi:hypothetical protein
LLLTGASCSSGEPPLTQGGGTQEPPDIPPQAAGAAYRAPYPDPPYGTKVNAVIENYRFLGWRQPVHAGFDVGRLEPISLSDFYDPNGDKGLTHIVLTSTAIWCSVCQYEYEDFRVGGRAESYGDRGVVFFGALFEDADSDPARPEDLVAWAETFDVSFPFVLDPSFKLGGFFDRTATPMTMVIDTRTMQVVWLGLGWAREGEGSVWAVLDSRL